MSTLLRLSSLALAALASAATGCGSSATASSTSLTAADVAMPAEREPSAPEAAAAPVASPAGELVCRAKDAFGVVNELSLTWTGGAAKGVLRRVTPSGMIDELPVRAERYRDLVIADAPNETDLMAHVAVVGRHKGKLHMRVGGTSPAWVPCE